MSTPEETNTSNAPPTTGQRQTGRYTVCGHVLDPADRSLRPWLEQECRRCSWESMKDLVGCNLMVFAWAERHYPARFAAARARYLNAIYRRQDQEAQTYLRESDLLIARHALLNDSLLYFQLKWRTGRIVRWGPNTQEDDRDWDRWILHVRELIRADAARHND